MSASPRSRDAVTWRHSIVNVVMCLAVGGTGVSVWGQNDVKRNAALTPSRKPAEKLDGKESVRSAILMSRDVPVDKMVRGVSASANGKALEIPLTIDTYASWDVKGDPSNVVLAIDVAALAGLGSGNPATMTGAGWDLTIDTDTPGLGSWLSEAVIEFDENVSPGANWISLSPGYGDDFSGTASYSSGGIVDFTDNLLPDIYLPDGLLRIEFFEDYDDADDAIDALYSAGSSITIALLDPNAGACCDDALATCTSVDPVTCAATAGQTFYVGEDCATYTCPPPPADYVMDGTPVTTCSGSFADSGNTAAPYSPNEYTVQTFTPATAGLALEFTFTFFEVETGYDSLKIYNGNSTAAPLIGTFDTGNPPGIITSGAGDGTLTFEFSSDGSVQKAGWNATIACVTPPAGGACCDGAGGCTDVADEAACVAGSYAGNGTACVSYTCPSPGDNCDNAIVVDFASDLPYSDIGQTTCGRGNDYASTCLGSYDGGEDVVYELIVPADMCVNIEMTSDTTYTGMAVDGVCPLGDPCLVKVTGSGTDASLLALTLTAGTHYLMLDTWPTPNCINSFDLSITQCPAGGACCHGDATCDDVADSAACVGSGDTYLGSGTACATSTCPPPNDDCDDATKISVVPFTDLGVDMTGATDDANVDPSCDSNFSCATGPANNGVWYTYTPTQSCAATIDQTGIDAATTVWTGADCTSLTQLVCSDPDPFGVAMSAGVEYHILVSNWSCSSEPTSAMDFSFDCVPLPKGACCVQESGSCSCIEVAGVDCPGTYRGDNTSCTGDPDPCDCNANGTCDPADLLPGVAQVYEATGLALDIPDLVSPGISSVLNVPTGGTIADLNVDLQITHTWVGDLCITLTHPSGSPTVQLVQRPGFDGGCDATGCCGCGGNNLDVVLDDEGGGGPIEGLCGSPTVPTSPPSYTPDEALSVFDGMDMAGDWTLAVNDNGDGDTGTLEGWSLHFNALPANSGDCNGNGLPDECEADCDGNGVPDGCDVDGSDPDGDGLVADDCNANGLPDVCDVPPLGSGADCQGDGIPDACQLYVAPDKAVVIDESFEDAVFPPAGWETIAYDANGPWDVSANPDYVHTGLQSAVHSWNATDGADSYLLTPELTITTGTLSVWSIGSFGQPWDGAYDIDVMIVIGAPGGGDDIFVGNLNDLWTDYFITWVEGVYDLSPLLPGGPFRIGFRYTGFDGDLGVIDDVVIEGASGPPANDCNGNGVPDECDAPVCGNDCLEGGAAGTTAEVCDGSQDEACPGLCHPAGHAFACECPSCGDGDINGAEDCDGGVCCTAGCGFDTSSVCRPSTGACDPAESCGGAGSDCPPDVTITTCNSDDGCCPAGCNANDDNDCAAICGNGVVESSEVCDGADDSACPGACATDCTCPVVGSIPTVSTWGLVALTLLLLAGAKVYFGRRSRSMAQ